MNSDSILSRQTISIHERILNPHTKKIVLKKLRSTRRYYIFLKDVGKMREVAEIELSPTLNVCFSDKYQINFQTSSTSSRIQECRREKFYSNSNDHKVVHLLYDLKDSCARRSSTFCEMLI